VRRSWSAICSISIRCIGNCRLRDDVLQHVDFGCYLAATINTAAVAKHHGVKAFINMSQMTVSQMSITETTPSPQHKLQWLSEQALNWSGLPVVHVRPTVFLEGFS